MIGSTLLFLFMASLSLTFVVRLAIVRFNVMDIPNDRSSHGLPTPKGGGLGFALITTLLMLLNPDPTIIAVAFTGLAIALTGFLDDVKETSFFIRFAIQSVCALVILAFLPVDSNLSEELSIPIELIYLLGFFFIVWLTNLYNFMDGIDGLAATQGILLGAALLIIDGTTDYSGKLLDLFLGLSAVLAGFMAFNFPPARIFMGDAGSAFLGFTLAGLCLTETAANPESLWLLLVLLAVFACDATAALLCRLIRGKKVYQAHRSHLYQLIVQHRQQFLLAKGLEHTLARTRAHRFYLILFCSCFLLVQLPTASLIASGHLDGWWATFITYSAILALHLWAGAGQDRLFPYGSMRKKLSR